MRLQEVGATKTPEVDHLDSTWYQHLSDVQLAAYIRYLFIYHREGTVDWDAPAHAQGRPHWDGGRDQFGQKYKSVWSNIVSKIRKHDAVPGIWVAAHFSGALHSVRISTGKNVIAGKPEILCSDISAHVYDEYVQNFNKLLLQQQSAAGASISTRYTITSSLDLPEDDLVLLVLCDTSHVNATPFFRHAFASSLNCQRAVNRFIWPAAVDYETKQSLYDKFIAENPDCDWFVSDGLKQLVADIRKHWSRYA